jgi:hypothetical protein
MRWNRLLLGVPGSHFAYASAAASSVLYRSRIAAFSLADSTMSIAAWKDS